ncbi:hypothetical protein GCM10009720_09370 [Yaniella flava]|uniref:Uncharacterized protein n=1 Tax=Yaniella flava TaxID=287930 RepID=A0ABP5FPC1_9MICC
MLSDSLWLVVVSLPNSEPANACDDILWLLAGSWRGLASAPSGLGLADGFDVIQQIIFEFLVGKF